MPYLSLLDEFYTRAFGALHLRLSQAIHDNCTLHWVCTTASRQLKALWNYIQRAVYDKIVRVYSDSRSARTHTWSFLWWHCIGRRKQQVPSADATQGGTNLKDASPLDHHTNCRCRHSTATDYWVHGALCNFDLKCCEERCSSLKISRKWWKDCLSTLR